MTKEELKWIADTLELISESLMEVEEVMHYFEKDKIGEGICERVMQLRSEAFELHDQVSTFEERMES